MDKDKHWIIQKNLLANINNSFFAVPNTLILTRNPWISVANPTDQPRYICKGETIGMLHNPDTLKSESMLILSLGYIVREMRNKFNDVSIICILPSCCLVLFCNHTFLKFSKYAMSNAA